MHLDRDTTTPKPRSKTWIVVLLLMIVVASSWQYYVHQQQEKQYRQGQLYPCLYNNGVPVHEPCAK